MSLNLPWVGLVPACETVEYGYPHPGCAEFGPPDEWACPTPACLLAIVGDPGDEHYEVLVCAECAMRYAMTIVRALDHVDFACHVLGIVDAAMLELDAKMLASAVYGVLAVGPYQLDAPYLNGWNEILNLRTAHLTMDPGDDR